MIAPYFRRAGCAGKERPPAPREERLYQVAYNKYVQHCTADPEPGDLVEYRRMYEGRTPPYIPLPVGRTEFHLGLDLLHWAAYIWNGGGPLPAPVIDYVVNNGCLPPHEAIGQRSNTAVPGVAPAA